MSQFLCNPYNCRNNGSWYSVPDEIRQPGRFIISSPGGGVIPGSTVPSVLQNIGHYAVESESAHYSSKKQYTIIPQYMHAVSAVVCDGNGSRVLGETYKPHSAIAGAELIAKNREPVRQLLFPEI